MQCHRISDGTVGLFPVWFDMLSSKQHESSYIAFFFPRAGESRTEQDLLAVKANVRGSVQTFERPNTVVQHVHNH